MAARLRALAGRAMAMAVDNRYRYASHSNDLLMLRHSKINPGKSLCWVDADDDGDGDDYLDVTGSSIEISRCRASTL
jgi:hypothetical protein